MINKYIGVNPLQIVLLLNHIMDKKNRTALITGATGGLGRAYARQLARKNYDLILTGRQEDKLSELALNLSSKYRITAQTVVCDLSSNDGINMLTQTIKANDGVDMLVSNAGYAERSRFDDKSVDDILKMISVHINATVQLVHAVLPDMVRKKFGNIISVSSLSAYVPAPGSSIYSSSKMFLNSFMESLHMEVRKLGINVQSLCPGLVHTDFHEGSAVEQSVEVRGVSLWMQPDEVVYSSLKTLHRSRVVHTPGSINKLIRFFLPLLPRRPYYSVVSRVAGKFK